MESGCMRLRHARVLRRQVLRREGMREGGDGAIGCGGIEAVDGFARERTMRRKEEGAGRAPCRLAS